MSDNQARLFCRMCFLLLCLLPTGVSAYWITHPQTAQGWELSLKAALGVETEIDFITTVSPYETILHQLRFTDPEYGTLFEATEVRVTFGKDNQVYIPYPARHLNNLGLAKLTRSINRQVLRSGQTSKKWKIIFGSKTPIAKSDAAPFNHHLAPLDAKQIELENLQIDVGPHVNGSMVMASFYPARDLGTPREKDSQEKLTVFHIVPSRIAGDQEISLHSYDHPLPCWLLEGVAGQLTKELGDHSVFQGELACQLSPQENRLFLHGVVSNVEVISPDTRGEIELNNCRFVNGQVEDQHWDAELRVPDHPPMKIEEQLLYQKSNQVAIDSAIMATVTHHGRRVADLPSGNRDR